MDAMMTMTEAATTLGLSPNTVRRWADDGTIAGAVRRGVNNARLVPRSEIERILLEKPGDPATDDMVTLAAAARELGLTVGTLQAWTRTGRIERSVMTKAQGRLVPRAEVERVLAEREAARQRRASHWVPMLGREWRPE